MKKTINKILLGTLLITSFGCKKFLDINQNPNNPTDATPELILPQAIVTASNTTVAYDNFGAWTGGYKANAGGYGGFGVVWTYTFTTGDYTAMWTNAFSAINQLNVIISKTQDQDAYKYYNAMARVLKGYLYTRLVDQYGDVPYSDAGKGLNNLTPKYDSYADVYKAVYADLNAAIGILNSAPVTNITKAVTSGQDPFGGGSSAAGLTKWKQLAQTIKLKMLIRAQKVTNLTSWVATAKASLPTAEADYLTSDAIVNPGFTTANSSQMNSKWTSYAWNLTGTAIGSGLSQLPTPWILSFYNGTKISDAQRGRAIYAAYGTTVTQSISSANISFTGPATNQLGYDAEPVKRSQNGSYWYSGVASGVTTTSTISRATGTAANSATNVGGVLKGATMGNVLMTLSEAKFLLAEASLASVSIVSVGVTTKDLFESGITASYQYLYSNAANSAYLHATPAATLKASYVTANNTNRLVNFDLATTDDQKLEAIITQKYIAVNFINSEEGFNEYRRTGYPAIANGSTVATQTFASLKSAASAGDKLPTRVLYPDVEFQINTDNVPKNVNPFTTKIFYAK
ncbi:SusD/RagB family nutrient-binding outer membrane lipoprotein [Nubsella zeaxanthinifaciens]|uniref:SusD/RagB family nutrient-binding outer membrane lipoprotein n=1 Tax=Nubsella zeaxanthinifaciens TaxID=392412 RepID=UPI003CFBD3D6